MKGRGAGVREQDTACEGARSGKGAGSREQKRQGAWDIPVKNSEISCTAQWVGGAGAGTCDHAYSQGTRSASISVLWRVGNTSPIAPTCDQGTPARWRRIGRRWGCPQSLPQWPNAPPGTGRSITASVCFEVRGHRVTPIGSSIRKFVCFRGGLRMTLLEVFCMEKLKESMGTAPCIPATLRQRPF